MLKSGAEDLLAHMVVQRVVQDKLKLRHARQKGIHDHPEYLKSHLVRGPFGFLQEPIDVDEVFRFMQPAGENHLTDGVNPHGQDPSGDQHREVPQTRRSEAILNRILSI